MYCDVATRSALRGAGGGHGPLVMGTCINCALKLGKCIKWSCALQPPRPTKWDGRAADEKRRHLPSCIVR